MIPFMESERLGDTLEQAYRRLHAGDGAEFGVQIALIKHILGLLADAGMITNITRKNMATFLSKDISLTKMEVISKNTNSIVLVNTAIHEHESFELDECITWITDELCKDSIMKKALCGREDYEGVKKVLNSYSEKRHQSMMKESWVDFYISRNKVFYTKKDKSGIHLYMQEMNERNIPLSGKIERHKDLQLEKEDLLDGRIYRFSDDTLFIETDYGYVVRIKEVNGVKFDYSRIVGSIVNQLDDGSILFTENGKLIRLKPNGRRKTLVDNAFLGMTSIEGNKVFWKCHYRKKDLETGKYPFADNCLNEKVETSLMVERKSHEIVWKSLLFTLYNFDNMVFDNKIGNRFRFARFFDKLPTPFSMDEISKKITEIDSYCYYGEVAKTDEYPEAMSYLMSIEDKGLDEKQTFNALVYFLDNTETNPYERIVTNSGTEVMSCLDVFFGDFDCIGEEATIDDIMAEDIESLAIEEITRKIDWALESIEKQIEEEKTEKETTNNEEGKQQRRSKRDKKDKTEKGKPVKPVNARSAEGAILPSDD